jgi:hypothetical protein
LISTSKTSDDNMRGTGPPPQAEIDGIREAVRLNGLQMEHLELSQTDRRAIRADVARLVHLLTGLLALSPR